MNDLIAKIADLVNELQVVSEENSLIVNVDHFGVKTVHVSNEPDFFKMFSRFEEEFLIGDYEFPYKLKTKVEGVEFFTLLNLENYEKYVSKTK